MNKLTYAEAVKWIDRLMPETDLPDEGIEALAVLRRAEGVMGAVEGDDIGRMIDWMDAHSDYLNHTPFDKETRKRIKAILRAALAYKVTP